MLQTVVLALVQSVTEFLPVSSSAHLILVPRLFGWPDQGLAADIALHVGTLFSVALYFRRDVADAVRGGFDLLRRTFSTPQARLTLNLGVACVPVFLIGFFFNDCIEGLFRDPRLIAVTAIVFGVLLYLADRVGKTDGTVAQMTVAQAGLIGLAQVLALMPGVSRSGVTMTAARALGIGRAESARFSMLLSVPTIGAAGALGTLKLLTAAESQVLSVPLVGTGVLLSFAGGVLAIGFLMKWLKNSSFAVFAAYRIALGIFLFYIF